MPKPKSGDVGMRHKLCPILRRWALLAAVLVFAGPVMANPCVQGGAGGMGGTGLWSDSGIGGTGTPAAMQGRNKSDDGSGTGGTGLRADGLGVGGTGHGDDGSGLGGTRVVGVITGFGSVCVNGLELHYDGWTLVARDGEPVSAENLAVGQWVSVQAEGRGDSLRAQFIAVHSALVGPVSWVSPNGDSFVSLGQLVRLHRVKLPNVATEVPKLEPGQMVRVSGVRDAHGDLLATRVEQVRPDTPVHVMGDLVPVGGGLGRMGNLVVTGLKPAQAAGKVQLRGKLTGDVLQVEKVLADPVSADLEKAQRAVLQGPVVGRKASGELDLGYARVRVPKSVLPNVQLGEWVRVEVSRGQGAHLEGHHVVRESLIRVRDRVGMDDRGGTTGRPGGDRRDDDASGGGVERPGRDAGPEKADKSEKADKIEKTEKAEKVEKADKVEKAEKAEKAEKVEKPERAEKPEKTEKAEKPEKVEKPEKHEKHD